MPQGDEGEDREHVADTADLGDTAARATAERDVDVADDPAVKAAVPAAPEGECGVVVRHAADDVLGRIDTVDQGPEAEEAPWDKEFEPDDVQVEEGKHAELEGRVGAPVWGGLGDRDHVGVVEEKFHAKEGEQETDPVESCAAGTQ